MKESRYCNVCKSGNLEVIFEAKGLPLTGLYLSSSAPEPERFDQAFMFCQKCTHGQLRNIVPAEILYDDTYSHRTSTSPIATGGNDFFAGELFRICADRRFTSILEVGCNDLYLMHKLKGIANQYLGIDPIWKGKDHSPSSSTRVLGRFAEELQFSDFDGRPDLIISAHTFEHVQDLRGQLMHLVELAADRCLFVIEMPSFDMLIKQRRFDQVFHQHIQYLSLSSMRKLVTEINCSYLGHTFNFSYWGGTLLFWFEKRSSNSGDSLIETAKDSTVASTREAFEEFKRGVCQARKIAEQTGENCFAFGAAQMLPVLAYHMESDFGFMSGILDDNPERIGCRLPSIRPRILAPSEANLADSVVMVTALDSSRALLRRILALNPRRIIQPTQIF